MKIFTIGFTQKTAEEFFNVIKTNNINFMLDIRLNNISQLAGFAKGKDLEYFLKVICNCEYVNDIRFAPTKELLDNYRAKKVSWDEYEHVFGELIDERRLAEVYKIKYLNRGNVCLLCSEPTPEHCHRRLLAEMINKEFGAEILHL